MRVRHPIRVATLSAPVRSLLLATLLLLVAAPVASADLTVDLTVTPAETIFGETTELTGTVELDGAPVAGQVVRLEGRRHPFDGEYRRLGSATTSADGDYSFTRLLVRNWDFRVRAGTARSARQRAFLYPVFGIDFRARSATKIVVIARYRVPFGVRLTRRTLFYVARRGAKRGPIAARAVTERLRAGRYRARAVVELPASWNGRFRYGACLPYSPGSGVGDPRVKCKQRLRFR